MSIKEKLESQLKNNELSNTTGSRNILDIIYGMFDSNDYVKIKNPMKVEAGWLYTDPKETRIEQPDSATRRIYYGKQKIYIMKPGETKIMQGWLAYAGLSNMWYQWNNEEKPSSNMVDVINKQEFLDKAFLGKYEPSQQSTPVEKSENKPKTKEKDKEDLGFKEN